MNHNRYVILACSFLLLLMAIAIKANVLWSITASSSIPWLLTIISSVLIMSVIFDICQMKKMTKIIASISIALSGCIAVIVDSNGIINNCVVDLIECSSWGIAMILTSLLVKFDEKPA